MSVSRRKKITEIAISHAVWILEDEVASNYLPPNPSCFFNLAPEHTFYINSHSKTVAPVYGVGYLPSPRKLVDSVAASIVPNAGLPLL
jgi:DNA-binding transcriptional MocR family regulator